MAFDQYKNSPYSVGLLLHILFDKYGIMESDYWTYGRDVIKHGIETKDFELFVRGFFVSELVRPLNICDKEKLVSWGELHGHTIIIK